MTERFNGLSPEARDRAEAMLPTLADELRRGMRRRAARKRAGVAALGVALLATGVLLATLPARRTPAPQPQGGLAAADAPAVETAPTLIEIVRTVDASMIEIVGETPGPSALSRYAVSPRVDLSSILVGDEEILDLLRSIGRPTGLARARGRVWFTEEVTDPIGGGT